MIRDTKKIISILQLKFLISFAQALFNPKGNSSKDLYTLEGIWGNLENPGLNTPIHGKGHIKVKVFSLIFHIQQPFTQVFSMSSEGHLLYSIRSIEKNWAVLTQMHQIKVRKLYTESHCRCLTQLLMLNETSVRPSEGRLVIPVLVYLGIGASQGKKTNKGHGYTEIHP